MENVKLTKGGVVKNLFQESDRFRPAAFYTGKPLQ